MRKANEIAAHRWDRDDETPNLEKSSNCQESSACRLRN